MMADQLLHAPIMASDFAPLILSPVGYETSELHRLLIDFQVQAFTPCPNYYDERLVTMPPADFCLITFKLSPEGAIGFHLVRSFQSMTLESQGTSSSALGCSCSEVPINRAFERSDYVGRVISASVTPDEVVESQLIAQEVEVLKGKPDQSVFFSAATHNAECEAIAVVCEQYIVFEQYGKKLVLHSCSDTKML
ncbi:hypothetical protein [Rheinheimera baltica]|uniref:hypothetical protein n=1 Tax=Rheinheimera baltica TaxID=67576 RepID=UPI00273F7E2E|nr:hypothetical protein [Rheinheimera baltica]MDP5144708.1 hypothetical protein [Rheinheimera baltica]MDP5151941.1 hypothetical protein [Rheinheimera baltica]MDP5189994.1 hypothetical protein [Rheinheimera baltica]